MNNNNSVNIVYAKVKNIIIAPNKKFEKIIVLWNIKEVYG